MRILRTLNARAESHYSHGDARPGHRRPGRPHGPARPRPGGGRVRTWPNRRDCPNLRSLAANGTVLRGGSRPGLWQRGSVDDETHVGRGRFGRTLEFRARAPLKQLPQPARPSKSTSTASCTTRKTPRSASTITACSTATASSRACAATAARCSASSEHLDRLWNSAKAIWLEIPISREEMAEAVNDTLAANGINDGYIRLVVTRGAGTLGLDPNRCSQPAGRSSSPITIALYPDELYARGWRSSRPARCATIRRRSARGSSRSTT